MSGTPYGLLGTPTLGQQPGSGLGSLYNAVVPPSTWGSAPTPAPPPTYDQWGRIVGAPAPAPVPNLNTGPGLPSAYGTSGYDMWGRMAPQPVQAQQAPPQQGFDASGIDPKTMAALSASAPAFAVMAALSGLPNPYAGVPQGAGGGLLGQAVAGDGGGAGGDRGPSQGNQGQQDAATAAGGMAASGDTGPSAGGGSAASEDK
jgi:hypothetical protein